MKSKITAYIFFVLLSTVFTCSSVLAADAEKASELEQVVLQLKWKHQFQFAGFYAAQKQGFYKEAGFKVDIHSVDFTRSASEIVLAGDADFGVADSSLVLSRLQGKPVVVLGAIFQHSPLVLLTKEESNILSPLELFGKRVMYQRNIDDAVLTAMFSEVGLNEKNHTHVPHSFRDEALLTDEVDAMSAYITDQVYFFKSKGVDINIIKPANYGIDFYGDMLFTTEKHMRDKKEQVLKFRDASLKGWAYAIEHPEEMVDWIIEKYKVEKTREHLLFEAENTIRLIQPKLVELGYFSNSRFLRIAEIYKSLGLAKPYATTEGLSYAEYDDSSLTYMGLYLLYAGLAVATILAFSLYFYSRRLRQQIEIRSHALNEAKREMVHHVDVFDRFVINCGIDAEGRFLHASTAFCEITGYKVKDLIGERLLAMVDAEHKKQVEAATQRILSVNSEWSGEVKLVPFQERDRDLWLNMRIESIVDSGGNVSGAVIVGSDLTDHKMVEKLSRTDTLTQLYNRRGLNEVFSQLLAVSKRYKKSLSFIIFDIDKFKNVNDTYGHAAGDYLIQEIAAITKSSIRGADVAGRWGGEEFVVVCPETDLNGVYMLAEKLRKKIAGYKFKDLPMQSCSFGVAQWNAEDTYGGLISRADKNMYLAKERGRNRTEGYSGQVAELSLVHGSRKSR